MPVDIDNLQIASLISDTRIESSYEIEPTAGRRSTVRIVEFTRFVRLSLCYM